MAVEADLDTFACADRRGEAGGGAEQCWGALPLERRLPFHQALLAVGAGHVQGRRLDSGRRLCFGSWSNRVDGSDPQVLLSTTERPVMIQSNPNWRSGIRETTLPW